MAWAACQYSPEEQPNWRPPAGQHSAGRPGPERTRQIAVMQQDTFLPLRLANQLDPARKLRLKMSRFQKHINLASLSLSKLSVGSHLYSFD